MKKLPGHDLPTFDDDSDDDSDDDDLAPVQLSAARKIHEQLTDIIIELGKNVYPWALLPRQLKYIGLQLATGLSGLVLYERTQMGTSQ